MLGYTWENVRGFLFLRLWYSLCLFESFSLPILLFLIGQIILESDTSHLSQNKLLCLQTFIRVCHLPRNAAKSFMSVFHNSPNWKQLKCPSTCKWINKIQYNHTLVYYLAVKKNEVLISATTWMDLENMMQSERSLFIGNIQKRKGFGDRK